MFRRIKTLWTLSGIDLNPKEQKKYVNPVLSVDGIKERLGVKKMATIIQDKSLDIFPDETGQ